MIAYELNHPTERAYMAEIIVSELEKLAYIRVFEMPFGEEHTSEISYGIVPVDQDDRGAFVEHNGDIYVLTSNDVFDRS